MGEPKTASVPAIINGSNNILAISQKISTQLSTIIDYSNGLQQDINKLSEYDGSKVTGTTHIIEKTDSNEKMLGYSKWKISGYENIESDIDELNSMIYNLTTINENFTQEINNMISTACEIDEIQQEILKILSSNEKSSIGKNVYITLNQTQKYKLSTSFYKLIEKYTNNSNNLQYPEITNANFTPQSITTVGSSYFVSAYKKGEKSRIYIYDKETKKLTGEIILNNSAHVGGISYDDKNNVLYVAGSKGTVNIYDYRQIKKNLSHAKVVNLNTDMEASSITIKNNITINKKEENNSSSIQTKVGKSSTLYQKDDKLYVATFDGTDKGEVVEYQTKITENPTTGGKEFQSSIINKYDIEPRTQGIAEVNYNNKDYLVTTQSIGTTRSQITLYEKQNNSIKEVGKYSGLQAGLEGITPSTNGEQLTMCYETGAKNTITISMDEIIEKCSSGKYNPDYLAKKSRDIAGTIYNFTN